MNFVLHVVLGCCVLGEFSALAARQATAERLHLQEEERGEASPSFSPSAGKVLRLLAGDGSFAPDAVSKLAADANAFTCEELMLFLKKVPFQKYEVVKHFFKSKPCTGTSSIIDPNSTVCDAIFDVLKKEIFTHETQVQELKQLREQAQPGKPNEVADADLPKFLDPAKPFDTVIKALSAKPFHRDAELKKMMEQKELPRRFSCKQVQEVIQQMSFPRERLTALEVLKDKIVDAQNKMEIVRALPFKDEKLVAAKALEDVCGSVQTSPVFGTVRGDPLVFVIDKSGSMRESFEIDGQKHTRWSFCFEELKRLLLSLPSSSRFNVITFASSAASAFKDAQSATEANVQAALEKVASHPVGGTNAHDALKLTYSMESTPERVYFLSDGEPTESGSATQILGSIADWDSSRGIPVNTIAFLRPGNDMKAKLFMEQLANKTGGEFRGFWLAMINDKTIWLQQHESICLWRGRVQQMRGLLR